MGQITGSKIKNRRMELGLSLREAAERAGVTASTFYKWENGVIDSMRVDKVKRLAQALVLEESELLTFEPVVNRAQVGDRKKHTIAAERLQKALDDLAMRPVDLAELTGVAASSISQYLSGRCAPGNRSAKKIGAVLNVSPLWLMELSDEKNAPVSAPTEISDDLARKALALYADADGRVLLGAREKLSNEQFKALAVIVRGMTGGK